jgi:hypothetical protein
MSRIPTLLLGIAILAATTSLSAQWPRYPTPGPKNPDGKIIQTPLELVVIYEGSGTTVRELFLDGRVPAKDGEPWWNGYSTGHWEGDTLVVETTGFMDVAGYTAD